VESSPEVVGMRGSGWRRRRGERGARGREVPAWCAWKGKGEEEIEFGVGRDAGFL